MKENSDCLTEGLHNSHTQGNELNNKTKEWTFFCLHLTFIANIILFILN